MVFGRGHGTRSDQLQESDSSTRARSEETMKLAKLLEVHDQAGQGMEFTPLHQNLGDGYLLRHNRIFRNVRRATMAAGFQFSFAPDTLYQALPLSRLENILLERRLPAVDNVQPLRLLEPELLRSLSWDDISDPLARNHIFHESCHAVFRTQWPSRPLVSHPRDLEQERRQVLLILLEESFANACELMAIIDAQEPAHRIFFELNSYIFMLDDRAHLKNAAAELGTETLFCFLLLCYLHANFRFTGLSDQQLDQVLELTSQISGAAMVNLSSGKVRKTLRALSRPCFELNPRFRDVTTGFYLQLLGFRRETKAYLDFNFTAALAAQTESFAILRRLIQNTLA